MLWWPSTISLLISLLPLCLLPLFILQNLFCALFYRCSTYLFSIGQDAFCAHLMHSVYLTFYVWHHLCYLWPSVFQFEGKQAKKRKWLKHHPTCSIHSVCIHPLSAAANSWRITIYQWWEHEWEKYLMNLDQHILDTSAGDVIWSQSLFRLRF